MKTLENHEIKDKKIIFRADLNVPVFNGKIIDYSRIDSIISSINQLSKSNNKIFILAHLGRPKGLVNKKYSLSFLCDELSQKLKVSRIHFLNTFNNEEIVNKQLEMKKGEVCLFENIRFYKEEENNDIEFSKNLSKVFQIYVNDAFSVSHRSHSSIVGLPKFLPAFAGINFIKEIKNLNHFLHDVKKPNLAIIGGSKVSTKIKVIYNLINLFDSIVIGGAMANTFLVSNNIEVGKSIYEKDFIGTAKDILEKAKKAKCKIILPIDAICSKSLEEKSKILECNVKNIPKNEMILDVGKNTINLISDQINISKSVLWNGPLGAFEYKPFDKSSVEIANLIKKNFYDLKLDSLAGGGDTLSVIKLAKANDGFNYLSNAGGAFLEWLEGKKSPGYLALTNNNVNYSSI